MKNKHGDSKRDIDAKNESQRNELLKIYSQRCYYPGTVSEWNFDVQGSFANATKIESDQQFIHT